MDCFYLVDGARSGIENMETDHQMLALSSVRDVALLRVYEWDQPTVSLGYFQKYDDRESHLESKNSPCVRRSTGGGAIMHHYDITYSLALPPSYFAQTSRNEAKSLGASQPLYDCIHDTIVLWLRTWGIQATKWPEPTCKADSCSFLCFERRSLGDVVAGDAKIMGSAQRRYKGALLQHGSLLLKRSPFAPSLAGLNELDAPVAELNSDLMAAQISSSLEHHVEHKFRIVDTFSDLLAGQPSGSYALNTWERKR